MYRQQRGVSIVFLALCGAMLVFGGYYLWRGALAWFESGGDITAPATLVASTSQANAGLGRAASPTLIGSSVPLDFLLVSPTPARACAMFRVTVIRARIRECPDTSCRTLEQPAQGTRICVYGPAQADPQYPEATDWYEINLDPNDPLPRLGFMHRDVIEAISPTKRPTRTATPLPTVTPPPTKRPTRTLTPSQTFTPAPRPTDDPRQTPTPRPTLPPATPTPTLPVHSA
jgi:hypothetical protein